MKASLMLKGIFAMLFLFLLASCKSENNENSENSTAAEGEPVEIIGDSISPTGSDGLGREIDTVEQIERHLDSINDLPQ